MFLGSISGTHVAIKVNDDPHVAPRYSDKDKQLMLLEVVITEKGTDSHLPIVDFVLTDKDGNKHFFMATGRIVNGIAAAIKGVNLKNHGVDEP